MRPYLAGPFVSWIKARLPQKGSSGAPRALFKTYDANKDGLLDVKELSNAVEVVVPSEMSFFAKSSHPYPPLTRTNQAFLHERALLEDPEEDDAEWQDPSLRPPPTATRHDPRPVYFQTRQAYFVVSFFRRHKRSFFHFSIPPTLTLSLI